jgi:hypothetical protein
MVGGTSTENRGCQLARLSLMLAIDCCGVIKSFDALTGETSR